MPPKKNGKKKKTAASKKKQNESSSSSGDLNQSNDGGEGSSSNNAPTIVTTQDPNVLLNNYTEYCKHIGLPVNESLKKSLTFDERNQANYGKQILVDGGNSCGDINIENEVNTTTSHSDSSAVGITDKNNEQQHSYPYQRKVLHSNYDIHSPQSSSADMAMPFHCSHTSYPIHNNNDFIINKKLGSGGCRAIATAIMGKVGAAIHDSSKKSLISSSSITAVDPSSTSDKKENDIQQQQSSSDNNVYSTQQLEACNLMNQIYTGLKELRIWRSDIENEGMMSIAEIIRLGSSSGATSDDETASIQLQYLEIANDFSIQIDGFLALGRSLSCAYSSYLTTLILDSTLLGSIDTSSLSNINKYEENDPTNTSNNNNSNLKALCTGLRTNSTIKRLSLRNCFIQGCQGGLILGEMLSFPKTQIQHLDLTGNLLGGLGLYSLCTGQIPKPKSKSIKHQKQGQQQQEDEGEEDDGLGLNLNQSLISINLSDNQIVVSTSVACGEQIQAGDDNNSENVKKEKVTMRMDDNEDDGIKGLTAFSKTVLMKPHPNLKEVDMMYNPISTYGANILIQGLNHHSSNNINSATPANADKAYADSIAVQKSNKITVFKVDTNLPTEIYNLLFRNGGGTSASGKTKGGGGKKKKKKKAKKK